MAFQADLEFWGIDDSILESCCREKYERKLATVNQEMERECVEMQEDAPEIFPNNCMGSFQKVIWDLMEHPESSCTANMVSYISMMFVIVSTIGMSLNTMPGLKVVDEHSELQNNPMLERIEAVCIAWFTMEFVIRSVHCTVQSVSTAVNNNRNWLAGWSDHPPRRNFCRAG